MQGIVNEEAINRLNIEKMEAEDKAEAQEVKAETVEEKKEEVTVEAKPAKSATKKSTKTRK